MKIANYIEMDLWMCAKLPSESIDIVFNER